MRRIVIWLGLLRGAAPLAAQTAHWSVTTEVGEFRYRAAARDTAMADGGSLRLYRPSVLSLRLDRRVGTARVGLAVAYASAALAIDGAGTAFIASDNPLKLLEIAPTVSTLLTQLGPAATLRVEAGPVLDHWTWDLETARTRLGAQAALSIEAALGARVRGVVRAGVAVTGTMFRPNELPDGYASRTPWRRSISLGLRLGR